MPTHLVRRRPVRYPPSAEANHWVTINQIPAAIPKVVGDGLDQDQGDTVESPKPDPRVNKIIEIPVAPSAPPRMAAHSTADAELQPIVLELLSLQSL